MKKIIVLTVATVFMLTGCGAGATNTLSCSYTNDTNNLSTKTTYNIDYEGTEVKKIRVTYNYHQNANNDDNTNNGTDGVGTGTDGTTTDTQPDDDGIIDGVVGSAIDTIINGVTGTILDIAGLRERHNDVLNTYGNMPGFSVQTTDDVTDNDYKVTYIIDYDTISDNDLATLNLSRDIDTLRSNYTSQGFTCAE